MHVPSLPHGGQETSAAQAAESSSFEYVVSHAKWPC
eukprot:CAMPEP_0115292898 /NCGR_PEP_ID=MMETSP0270-20121206/65379_1 /TAXON_ID=71861 /ORGANISM="Scrippsiella trochoidea, Strain CCMP3099" /LENGTH=35 /DNA_ID= /DNA_START= /DNA_END= /DNA_ORIENTATION=